MCKGGWALLPHRLHGRGTLLRRSSCRLVKVSGIGGVGMWYCRRGSGIVRLALLRMRMRMYSASLRRRQLDWRRCSTQPALRLVLLVLAGGRCALQLHVH